MKGFIAHVRQVPPRDKAGDAYLPSTAKRINFLQQFAGRILPPKSRGKSVSEPITSLCHTLHKPIFIVLPGDVEVRLVSAYTLISVLRLRTSLHDSNGKPSPRLVVVDQSLIKNWANEHELSLSAASRTDASVPSKKE